MKVKFIKEIQQNRWYLICFILLFVLLITKLFVQSFLVGPSYDEMLHIGLGKTIVEDGWRFTNPHSCGHPILSTMLNSTFLFLLRFPYGIFNATHWPHGEPGLTLLYKAGHPSWLILFLSRLSTIIITIILTLFVYFWGKKIGGVKAGLISMFLIIFEPNILAHGILVNNDIFITTIIFVTMYVAWNYGQNISKKSRILTGISLGIAQLIKVSAIALYPMLFVYFLWRTIKRHLKFNRFLIDLVIFGIISIIIIIIGYRIVSLPAYIELWRRAINIVGPTVHQAFLAGEHSLGGWWYYFPVVFILKTPIALIILLLLSLVITLIEYIKKKKLSQEIFLLLPVVIFFLAAMRSSVNVGVRHILIIYPFFIVFTAVVISKWIKKTIPLIICILLFGWFGINSISIFPHYLAYFNEIAGGPSGGWRYLVDSNNDWGQGLPDLKKYMQKNNIKTIKLSYFGTDDPEPYGINYQYLPSERWCPPAKKQPNPVDLTKGPPTGLIAVSVTMLQGVYFQDFQSPLKYLRSFNPIAKVGYSIFVYDIPDSNQFTTSPRYRQFWDVLLLLRDYKETKFQTIITDSFVVAEFEPKRKDSPNKLYTFSEIGSDFLKFAEKNKLKLPAIVIKVRNEGQIINEPFCFLDEGQNFIWGRLKFTKQGENQNAFIYDIQPLTGEEVIIDEQLDENLDN